MPQSFHCELVKDCEIVSLSFSLGVNLQTVARCGDNQRRHAHLLQTALRATMHNKNAEGGLSQTLQIMLMNGKHLVLMMVLF